MVEVTCRECGNSSTADTFEEAEKNLICGLKLIRPGPCKEHILKRTCEGCPAYKVVQIAGTKESYDLVGKEFPGAKSEEKSDTTESQNAKKGSQKKSE